MWLLTGGVGFSRGCSLDSDGSGFFSDSDGSAFFSVETFSSVVFSVVSFSSVDIDSAFTSGSLASTFYVSTGFSTSVVSTTTSLTFSFTSTVPLLYTGGLYVGLLEEASTTGFAASAPSYLGYGVGLFYAAAIAAPPFDARRWSLAVSSLSDSTLA